MKYYFFGIVINGEIHPSSLQLFWELCVLFYLLAEHVFPKGYSLYLDVDLACSFMLFSSNH